MTSHQHHQGCGAAHRPLTSSVQAEQDKVSADHKRGTRGGASPSKCHAARYEGKKRKEKKDCCYEKYKQSWEKQFGRNHSDIPHRSCMNARSPPHLSCSEESPDPGSQQPARLCLPIGMLGSGSVSQQRKLSAGELRRPRQASSQVRVSAPLRPLKK